jgi:hypothetical protein
LNYFGLQPLRAAFFELSRRISSVRKNIGLRQPVTPVPFT